MWGRRGRNSDATGDASSDLRTLLLEGENMLQQTSEAHHTWGAGSADSWNLDQQSGLLTWTFPDKTATAPAQILGSHSATANGHAHLAEPQLEADDEKAATLATLAFRVTRATGFYRAPGASTL